MIRSLISVIRSSLVGPALTRMSRLKPGDVDNLLLQIAGSGGSVSAGGGAPGASSEALEQLKMEFAKLSERVEVLERLVRAKG